MFKVKLNLFDGVFLATVLPNIGLIFTTFALIISLIKEQKEEVYKGIISVYVVCLLLLAISLSICFFINKKSKKEVVFYEKYMSYINENVNYNEIIYCEYHVCKWYAIPLAYIYKQQIGGLIIIKTNNGKYSFKIFYKDYLKIRKLIENIVLK